MRQFLYLNTDIVNSIIAQQGKGLIDAFTTETETGIQTQEDNTINVNASGDVGVNFLKIAKAETSLGISNSDKTSISNSNVSKQIFEKTLHDAAFELALSSIKPNIIQKDNNQPGPGDYIEITRVFDFVDFKYLEKLFSKDGVTKYLKKKEIEKLKKENPQHNRRQIESLASQETKGYDEVYDIISALKIVIPYDRMLVSNDGYLIPTEDSYFRINPLALGFMYGGEIKCIGLITNIIGKDTNPDDKSNIFASFQFSVNELIRQILPTEEDNLYVVSPIAIFYEN